MTSWIAEIFMTSSIRGANEPSWVEFRPNWAESQHNFKKLKLELEPKKINKILEIYICTVTIKIKKIYIYIIKFESTRELMSLVF